MTWIFWVIGAIVVIAIIVLYWRYIIPVVIILLILFFLLKGCGFGGKGKGSNPIPSKPFTEQPQPDSKSKFDDDKEIIIELDGNNIIINGKKIDKDELNEIIDKNRTKPFILDGDKGTLGNYKYVKKILDDKEIKPAER